MSIAEQISDIAQRHLSVCDELEAMDVVFRMPLDGAHRRETPPWTMMGREELEAEELEVWLALDAGRLSPIDAVAHFKALMARYYGRLHDGDRLNRGDQQS